MIPRQDRLQETMETFTSEFDMRLFQELESMMSMMHYQTNRAISSGIAERVTPEIQNTVSSMSSSGYQDTEVSSSPNSQENTDGNIGFKSKITKGDSRSACDLRNNRNRSPYKKNYYFNVVSNVRIPLATPPKCRSEATCHIAMPQCCYFAKGAKRPNHTTNMLTFSNESSFIHIGCISTLFLDSLILTSYWSNNYCLIKFSAF